MLPVACRPLKRRSQIRHRIIIIVVRFYASRGSTKCSIFPLIVLRLALSLTLTLILALTLAVPLSLTALDLRPSSCGAHAQVVLVLDGDTLGLRTGLASGKIYEGAAR